MPSTRGRSDQSRYLKLLPVAEVKRIIASLDGGCGKERVPVDKALGRVAAEGLVAPEDMPSRPAAAMDGYAIRQRSLKGALSSKPVSFRVVGRLSPGDRSTSLPHVAVREAYHVSTGAPLPRGADLVIRVEDVLPSGLTTVKAFREFPRWKNISLAGEDVRRGSLLLKPHQIINSPTIAMLMACRRRTLQVFRRPLVGVLSTGTELTEFKSESRRQKRDTPNNYSNLVRGYLEQHGAATTSLGVCEDDRRDIARKVDSALEELDAVCTIGGSSVGPADFTPDAVSSVKGAELAFHGVRAVPIRPAGLATVKRRGRTKPVIMIPAHSVSAALTTFMIAIPVINMISGLDIDSGRIELRAAAEKPFENTRPIDALVLARTEQSENGEYSATPLSWGANLLSNLCRANSFVHLKARERIPRSGYGVFRVLGPLEMLRMKRVKTPTRIHDFS